MNSNLILLDSCITNNKSHYDIAKFIHDCIKDIYFYNNNDGLWYLKNNINDKNTIDSLKFFIKSSIVNQFISRSLYYSNLEESNDDMKEQNSIKSVILLKIANNLKNDKFIKDIIKEIKQFF